jgi:hypothetical protein
MAILTYIGITLLFLGYTGLVCVSLSSKSKQDEKNKQLMIGNKSTAINQPQKFPSNLTNIGTHG